MRQIKWGMLACAVYACAFPKHLFSQTTLASTQPVTTQVSAFGAGDHFRTLTVAGLDRTYLVHVPRAYDPSKPTPVVLALHGAAMTGSMMVWFSGLNKTSEAGKFIVVYPNGTGALQTWNAGSFPPKATGDKPDDVVFLGKALDDLGTRVNIDSKRVYACGMSNGAMMCYRLAAEMSDRIAAIAPVAGTIAVKESRPKRAVSVIHFHGTDDQLVPFKSPATRPTYGQFDSVEESVMTWVKLDNCTNKPITDTLSKDGDEMKVTRTIYDGGKDSAEVVLVTIEGGGHTWPGQAPPVTFIGKSALNISANDLIWEFFKKHPMK